jgi:hypothetical protein
MLEKRISFDHNDRPVEYGRDLYRGDRFRFETEAVPTDYIKNGNMRINY